MNDEPTRELPTMIGDYPVLSLLGEGGMGRVYLCRDPALEREVAVKVLLEDVARDSDMAERFLREARAMAKVTSPHVVTVFHVVVGHDDVLPHIVMEVLDGEDVADRLVRDGPIPWREAVELTIDAVKGLRAAEAVGIVHRDVKPANLFLTADGCKLTDFGLARPVDGSADLTAAGIIVGTPHYLAPEQARGGGGTIQSDIYSLGATLFRMLTGRPPYDDEAPLTVITKHITDPPPSLPDDIEAPAALDELIKQMMAKSVDDRPESYAALEQALVAIKDEKALPVTRKPEPRPISMDAATVVKDVDASQQELTAVEGDKPVTTPASKTAITSAPSSGSAGIPATPSSVGSKFQLPVPVLVAAGIGVLVVIIVVLSSGGGDIGRIEKGDAAAVLKEKDDVPAAERPGHDELVRGHALAKLQKDTEAIAAYGDAARKGASDDRARDFLLMMLNERKANDVIDALKAWPDDDVDARLAKLTSTGSWFERHHALNALHERGKAGKVDQEAFALRDLEDGTTCEHRKRGLSLLSKVGASDEAYGAVERAARQLPANLCMMLDFERAKRSIRSRQEG